MNAYSRFLIICRMIKIEHSIFALPFAYAGAILAKGGLPEWNTLFFLTLAMIGIRSFAMAMNRILDLPFDRKNPRSAAWPLVTGEISVPQTRLFAMGMAALFIASCAALNTVCLALAPFALAVAALYSYTKRFTWLCHFALGSVIGLAPIAGWLSVSPVFALPSALLGLGVLFWIAGFDIIYSGQDAEFDRAEGLYSMPARLGVDVAFALAAFSHANTVIFLFLAGLACRLSWGWYLFLAIAAWILYQQHTVAKTATPERLRKAFAMNGPISMLLLLGALMGVYW